MTDEKNKPNKPNKPNEATTTEQGPALPEASLFRAVGVGAAWLLGTAIAVRLGELLVGRNLLGAALVGAVIVDLATYRAGVRWDANEDGVVAARLRIRKGLVSGLLVSLALVSTSLLASMALLGAKAGLGSLSLSALLALLRAAAVATRDELLYRGVPLVIAKRAGIPLPFAIAFSAFLGAASLLSLPGSSWEAMVLMASQGVLYALLWARTGAAYAPVVAHAGWAFLAGTGLRGGLLEVVWGSGALAEGAQAKGAPALVAAGFALVFTMLIGKHATLQKWLSPQERP